MKQDSSALTPSLCRPIRWLPTVAAVALSLSALGCEDERAPCERCDLNFYWDSSGHLSDSDESCEEIDCGVAICGLCYDIQNNADGKPVSGICDYCQEAPDCGPGRIYCPTHPVECAARGIDLEEERCGCYDIGTDDPNCY